MKSAIRRDGPLFSLAIASGTLMVLSLFLSIGFLASHRTVPKELRPLLVVDLMAWPAPVKEAELPPVPKPETPPAPKKPVEKKPVSRPKPEPAPVVEQKPREIEAPPAVEQAAVNAETMPPEITAQAASPTPVEAVDNSLPTPVPFFQLTQSPRFLHREEPVYPEVMRAHGLSAVVKLEALIDKDGRVRKVDIIESAGEQFDEAAKQAIIRSTFYPAEIDGEPVAVLLRVPVKFKLL